MYSQVDRFDDLERARFQSRLRAFYYDDFIPKVARGRSRDAKYIDSISQGRVWTGSQAKDRGLVDELGGLERAIDIAKELAHIPPGNSVRRVAFPAQRTLFQRITGRDDDTAKPNAEQAPRQAVLSLLPEEVRRHVRYFSMLDPINRGEVIALMPYQLSIK